MRWLLRYEPVRAPKFGETRRDVSAWVVRAYLVRGGRRVFVGERTVLPNLTMAHRYATGRAVIHYAGRRRIIIRPNALAD